MAAAFHWGNVAGTLNAFSSTSRGRSWCAPTRTAGLPSRGFATQPRCPCFASHSFNTMFPFLILLFDLFADNWSSLPSSVSLQHFVAVRYFSPTGASPNCRLGELRDAIAFPCTSLSDKWPEKLHLRWMQHRGASSGLGWMDGLRFRAPYIT